MCTAAGTLTGITLGRLGEEHLVVAGWSGTGHDAREVGRSRAIRQGN